VAFVVAFGRYVQNVSTCRFFTALDELSALTNTQIPYPLAGLATRAVRFTDVIDAKDMTATVYETLGL
jgi:hypothetical protein